MEETVSGHGAISLPQPAELSEREKEDAMGAYLMMFAAWGAGLPLPLVGLIASIIYYHINKKSSPFAAYHSFQALLTHMPISIVNAVVVVWGAVLLVKASQSHFRLYATCCVFAAIWNVVYMTFSIIACVKARKGRFYYFWVFGRLAFAKVYLSPRKDGADKDGRNLPPEGL